MVFFPAYEMREVVRIATAECGGVGLSPCHYVTTKKRDEQAGSVVVGDCLKSMNGWSKVMSVKTGVERTRFYDISPNCKNYYVNQGLLIPRTVG